MYGIELSFLLKCKLHFQLCTFFIFSFGLRSAQIYYIIMQPISARAVASDVQLNLDYVKSMFGIIQSRTKSTRSINDHGGQKAIKQAEELDALRRCHSGVNFKIGTTKGWFNSMYEIITKFYDEQLAKVKFSSSRSWTKEEKLQFRKDYVVNLFKTGLHEELPGGSKNYQFSKYSAFNEILFILH